MARIALENTLEYLKNPLQSSGHEIVSLDQYANCDCCVVSGQEQNALGIHDTATQASVVNADGMTEAEVLQAVNERLQQSR